MITDRSIISQFFSGTLIIGLARGSTIVFGIISLMIAVRNVSPAEYGAYVLIIVVVGFLAEFLSFGMTLAIPKYLASNENESYKQDLNSTVLNFRLITILTVTLLMFALHPLLSRLFGPSLLLNLFYYLDILFGLASLSLLFNSIMRGQFNFVALGIIEFITNIAELAALALMVLVFHLGLYGLIYAKFVSGGLYIVLGYFQIHFRHKMEMDLPILKELLRFGFPLQIQFALDFSYSRIDTLIIGTLLGTVGIAYYEIARRIPDSLMQLYAVFVSIYLPISANLYIDEIKKKTERLMNTSVRILAFLTILCTLVAVIFGKDIIRLLFSDKYLPSYFAFVLLMISFTLKVFENTLGYSLVAIGEPDKTLIVNIVRTFFSLVGNIILLPIAGFIGAALVSIAGNLVAIPLDSIFLRRRKLQTAFDGYLKPIALLALFSVPFIGFGVTSLALKLFVFVLYFPACLLFSVITPNDLVSLYKEIQKTMTSFLNRQRLPSDL